MRRMLLPLTVWSLLACAGEREEWVIENGLPVATTDPGQGFEDLDGFNKMIGNDTVLVALGECTHGSREVFQMKRRLVEYLVTKMGFSIFAIEAAMSEVARINEYVEHGRGDPRVLLQELHLSWFWHTEEVLALIEWMRQYNASGKGPLRVAGFDMQSLTAPARIILEYLKKVDPTRARSFAETYTTLMEVPRPSPPFGTVEANLPVRAVVGKTVRLVCHIKTLDVAGHATLWLRAHSGGDPVAFRGLDPGVSGTTDWQRYDVALEVPPDATYVVAGLQLSGAGQAWFDGGRIEIDGKACPSPGFNFEGKHLEGFGLPRRPYDAELDATHRVAGVQALRIARADQAAVWEPTGLTPAGAVELARKRVTNLHEARERYEAASTRREYEWALQNARIITQFMNHIAGTVTRDVSMAENAKWILAQNPEARVVLWAHDSHVARQPGRMGAYLARSLGRKYRPVGFATGRGTYRAWDRATRRIERHHKLASPPRGSIEAILAATNRPLLIVDLRDAPDWLRTDRPFRSIGASEWDFQFLDSNLPQMFDLLVWIETTTAAKPLK